MPAPNDTVMPEDQNIPAAPETPDVEKMSLEELEAFVKPEGTPADLSATPAGDPSAAAAPEALPVSHDGWIEVAVGDRTLKFKNQEEFTKSFVNAQQLIKRFNDERSEVGTVRSQYEGQISDLTNRLDQLQAGAAETAAGTSVNPATQQALSALTSQSGAIGQDPLSLLYGEIAALKNDLETKTSEFSTFVQGTKQREADAVVAAGVQGIYSEVNMFSANHPEYKTDTPFDSIDDIVSSQGEESAQAQVSLSDWQKYQAVMAIVGMQKSDPTSGTFDLKRKNFSDLEEAHLVHQHRTGALGDAIAQAHKSGVHSFERVLNRKAQSATSLPNTLSSGNKPQMGAAEIESIMAMDPAAIKASPELTARFNEAAQALGINMLT